MIKFPVKYINGNYLVTIDNDGTKTRETIDNEFIPTRPETIDLNISNFCKNACPWCYMDASPQGRHGDVIAIKNMKIPPYTEVALNYALHPNLVTIFHMLREKRAITNITIHQNDLLKYHKLIKGFQLQHYIYGIGISVTDVNDRLIKIINRFDNVVIHVIAGITPIKTLEKMKDLGYKVLILGYKTKGRGLNVKPNLIEYKYNFDNIQDWFKIVSYDNLALEQLNIKDYITKEIWDTHYMGEEGQFSFFIDAVEKKYYKSSTESKGFDINNLTIKEMFENVKKNKM